MSNFRFRFCIPNTTLASLLPWRNGESTVRLELKQLPSMGREDVARMLSHRSRFHTRIESHSISVRNTEHVQSRRAAAILAICHRLTVPTYRRFQGIQSTVDHCPQNAWSQRKSGRLFAIGDDMRQLLEATRIFKPRGHAKQTQDGLRRRKYELPFVLSAHFFGGRRIGRVKGR